MMTTVQVAPTASNYQYEPFDNDTIKGDMVQWLHGNTKSYWNWERERNWLVFRFADPQEAALFKLTWA